MKILLISDTHGSIGRVTNILKRLTGIDLIIHCGDYAFDAQWLAESCDIPIVSVKGNSDEYYGDAFETVATPYGNLLVTHGHMQLVEFRLDNLLYLTEENHCIGACFGHTHIACCEETDGIHLINPGSLTDPRDETGGTFALINSTEENFYVDIVRYDTFMGADKQEEPPAEADTSSKKKTPKAKGGFLRNLLNHSDRF